LRRVRKEDPTPPRRLRPEVDQALETIVLKCLEKEPTGRYPSAAALADDLERWRRGEPVQVRPPGWAARLERKARRRPLVSALVVLALATALAVPTACYFTHPDRPLWAVQRQLARKQTVTLIGETGPPAWSRWPLGKAVPSEAEDQPFFLQAGTGLCLLELLPDPVVSSYLFSAEVRQDDDGGSFLAQVGLFFGYSEHPSAQGEQHCFGVLLFNDKKATVNLKASEVALRLFRRNPTNPQNGIMAPALRFQRFAPAGQRPAPWRRLAIEVRPEAVRCCWDGTWLGSVSRAELLQHSREHILASCPTIDPPFGPRGGLGLCLRAASAYFRRVTVCPLE
jgi:serine/threonine-protein kinase